MAVTSTWVGKCGGCNGGIAPGDKVLKQQGRWKHEACYVPKEQQPGQQLLPGLALFRAKELARQARAKE